MLGTEGRVGGTAHLEWGVVWAGLNGLRVLASLLLCWGPGGGLVHGRASQRTGPSGSRGGWSGRSWLAMAINPPYYSTVRVDMAMQASIP